MPQFRKQSFLTGLATGIAIAACAGVLLAVGEKNAKDDDANANTGTRIVEPMYFVTGDTINATLWRRNGDGSLTCISRNICRAPQRSR